MMYRIAVLMVERNKLQRDFLEHFEKELPSQIVPHTHQIDVFEIRECCDEKVQQKITDIAEYKPDLIITIGNYCSLKTKEAFVRDGITTPVIAASCYDPIGMGLVSREKSLIKNFAVVASRHPRESLPVEVLIERYEKIQRFIILHSRSALAGKISEICKSLARFARLQGKDALIMEYGPYSAELLKKTLNQNDAVVAPIGSLPRNELEEIDKIIRHKSTPAFLHADGEYASSAFCNYEATMTPITALVINYTKQILVDGKTPNTLPLAFAKDATKLAFANETITEDEWRLRTLLKKHKLEDN